MSLWVKNCILLSAMHPFSKALVSKWYNFWYWILTKKNFSKSRCLFIDLRACTKFYAHPFFIHQLALHCYYVWMTFSLDLRIMQIFFLRFYHSCEIQTELAQKSWIGVTDREFRLYSLSFESEWAWL